MQQLEFFPFPRRSPRIVEPQEWKVVALRECPMPGKGSLCDTPQTVVEYWRRHVATAPYYSPDQECFVTLLLDTRRRLIGHHLVGIGLLDSVLVHPREVFRAAIIAAAHAVVVAHNHPTGDPTPSTADIRTTRDLIRAGQLLKMELLDHVVIGKPSPERSRDYSSLKECGQFYS